MVGKIGAFLFAVILAVVVVTVALPSVSRLNKANSIQRAWDIVETVAKKGSNVEKFFVIPLLNKLNDPRALGILMGILDDAYKREPDSRVVEDKYFRNLAQNYVKEINQTGEMPQPKPTVTNVFGLARSLRWLKTLVVDSIRKFPPDTARPVLRQLLDDKYEDIRDHVLVALLEVGDFSVVEELKTKVVKPSEDTIAYFTKSNADLLMLLTISGSGSYTQDLWNWYTLSKNNPEIPEYKPLSYLARLGDTDAVEILRQLYRNATDAKEKANIMIYIENSGNKIFLPEIQGFLLDEDVNDSMKQLILFRFTDEFRDASNIEVLRLLSHNSNSTVRDLAVELLISYGDYESGEPLMRDALRSPNSSEKMSAAYALTSMGKGSYLSIFKDAMDDEDSVTRVIAAIYYIKLTYKDSLSGY